MAGQLKGRGSAHEGRSINRRPDMRMVAGALVLGLSVLWVPSAGALENEPGRLELLLAQQIPGIVAPGRIEKQFEEATQPKSTFEPIIPEGDEVPGRFICAGPMQGKKDDVVNFGKANATQGAVV